MSAMESERGTSPSSSQQEQLNAALSDVSGPVEASGIENVPATSTTVETALGTMNGTLHVRLKMLDERVFDVEVDPDVSVTEFRGKVAEVTTVPPELQRLIYRGKLLKDGSTLSSYAIQDGHTVHLVSKPGATAASTTSSASNPVSNVGAANTESSFLTSGIERNRERLRSLMRNRDESPSSRSDSDLGGGNEQRPVSTLREPGVLRPPMTMRRLEPGANDPTGDAWNISVLREALAQNEQASTRSATNPPTLPSVRRLFGDAQRREQHQMAANYTAADVAADLGLNAPTDRPNLDYLTQAILTTRTILATAAQDENDSTNDVADTSETPTNSTPPAPIGNSQAPQDVVSPRTSRRGRRQFFVGQWLDVKDTVNQWLECTVMDIADNKVLVHYHGWPSRWDEWIDFDSDRIAAFRTRTPHSLNAQHMSPIPSTRLPNAPSVGEYDIQQLVPQLRDLMRDVLPHIERLAELCEQPESMENALEEDNDETSPRTQDRTGELSDMAHLVAPLFDRVGRLMIDSARQLDPILRPELRQQERSRQMRRTTDLRANTATSVGTQTSEEDPALSIRDLISTTSRVMNDSDGPRRNIDVHIHAIVSPSSLSSLASLARIGTAIAGAMGSRSNPSNPSLQAPSNTRPSTGAENPFGFPSARPLQPGSEGRSILNDIAEPEDEDFRSLDQSRTPLLSAYRGSSNREDSSSTSAFRRRSRVDDRVRDFLSDDFFGTSFSQDSDDSSSEAPRDSRMSRGGVANDTSENDHSAAMVNKVEFFVLASLFLTPAFVIISKCAEEPSLFALHPAANALAHLVFSPASIYIMLERKKVANPKTRISMAKAHWFLQLLALLCMGAGGAAAYLTKENFGKPHFTSTHSWLAGAFGTLWFVNYLGGATTTFLSKNVDWHWKNPAHRIGGIIAFAGCGATLAFGIFSGSWGNTQLGADKQRKVVGLIGAAYAALFLKAILNVATKPSKKTE
ncbi:hypothetical protein Poli38472_004419 [Pythium oligandrum]|uniref:Ubiquitin-like domain-containing protein n=1 Tax=Pythium oligandrum TaxID=41045 RepID=A0A8K1CA72_PYTOL|nr:hypothetical protein Poli38472_004419 [Pythium oligandrum]|eukprot:TMW59350.1 hypothetical protein Poli38472_004419 [Pythium oligandrum]